MTAGLGYILYQKFPQFLAEGLPLLICQSHKVLVAADVLQNAHKQYLPIFFLKYMCNAPNNFAYHMHNFCTGANSKALTGCGSCVT